QGNATIGDFAVMHFDANGTADANFGGPGQELVTVFFGSSATSGAESAGGVAVEPDGKIVVGGYTNLNGGTAQFAVARLTGGTLDSNFGNGGKQTVAFPTFAIG